MSAPAAGAGKPQRIVELSPKQPGDLTEFRRAALARIQAVLDGTLPAFQDPVPAAGL